jgi:nucleoside-diphosphate kinase
MSEFLVLIKPDAVSNNVVGSILSRFEPEFRIKDMFLHFADESFFKMLYEEHIGKPHYDRLIKFSTSGPSIFVIFNGDVKRARELIGKTDPKESPKGTIRGDFGSELPRNAIHCSANEEEAKRELEGLSRYLLDTHNMALE